MAKNISPTRANLMKTESQLEFSKKGYDLLDKKRTVLIQEIMSLIDQTKEIEERINVLFAEAYQALQECIINLGISTVEDYSLAVAKEKDYQLRLRSIMGVDIPEIAVDEEQEMVPLGFSSTSPALDIALKKFNEVKYLSYQLAIIETTALKLSNEIKKTSKSANALSKIKIPELQKQIHDIESSIEEKEREETFRIKKVKKHNLKKKGENK